MSSHAGGPAFRSRSAARGEGRFGEPASAHACRDRPVSRLGRVVGQRSSVWPGPRDVPVDLWVSRVGGCAAVGLGWVLNPRLSPPVSGWGGGCACHSFTAKLIILATAELTSLDAPFTSGGGPADRAEILTSFWLNKPTVRLGPTPPVRGAALWAEAEEKARPFPVAAVTSAVPVQTVN